MRDHTCKCKKRSHHSLGAKLENLLTTKMKIGISIKTIKISTDFFTQQPTEEAILRIKMRFSSGAFLRCIHTVFKRWIGQINQFLSTTKPRKRAIFCSNPCICMNYEANRLWAKNAYFMHMHALCRTGLERLEA